MKLINFEDFVETLFMNDCLKLSGSSKLRIRFYAQWNIYHNYGRHIDLWLRKFDWLGILPSVQVGSYFTFDETNVVPLDISLVIMKENEATRELQQDWFNRMTKSVRNNAKKSLIIIFSNQSIEVTQRRKSLYENLIPNLNVEYIELDQYLPKRFEYLSKLLQTIAKFIFRFQEPDIIRDQPLAQKYFLRLNVVKKLHDQLPEIEKLLSSPEKRSEIARNEKFYQSLVHSRILNIMQELGFDIISLRKRMKNKTVNDIIDLFPRVEEFLEKILLENLLIYMIFLNELTKFLKNALICLRFMIEKYLARVQHKCSFCYNDTSSLCSLCRLTCYCSQDHQRLEWSEHKLYCETFVQLNSFITKL